MTRERRYFLIAAVIAVVLAAPLILRSQVSVGEKVATMVVGIVAVVTWVMLLTSKQERP